ncbi:transmembrane protein 132E isoform X3 [Cloeon dipterum]|uniref:transmembrane protein 132E isoform X3 n=1 Tax=Cloeon dipterum TaxID=197152 RepID=UPI0032201845
MLRAWTLLAAVACAVALGGAGVSAVEVHFENKDGGFFLKYVPAEQSSKTELEAAAETAEEAADDEEEEAAAVLSEEHLTVLQSAQPAAVRATFGPFSTKQTVPARYVVPDATVDASAPPPPAPLPPDVLDADLLAHTLDVSAHLVTPQVPRDAPVLRVLFHAGQHKAAAPPVGAPPPAAASGRRQQRVCIVLHATLADRPAEAAACSPGGDDGVCLAQLTLPAAWWPSLPSPDFFSEPPHETKPVNKVPRRMVRISYSVFEPRGSEPCSPSPSARVQIQPATPLGAVPLVSAVAPYRKLRADPGLAMVLPYAPLYPRSRFYVPLFVQPRPNAPAVSVLLIRARVKSGLRILGAQATSSRWHVTVETNPKQTIATVTAFRKDENSGVAPPTSLETEPPAQPTNEADSESSGAEEVFNWLLEVEESSEPWEGGRVVWGIRYVLEGDTRFHGQHTPSPATASAASSSSATSSSHFALQQRRARLLKEGGGAVAAAAVAHDEDERRKITARFETQKDDIHAVLPISKSWEVLNTAVLTGRQVSQAMKVFIVSRAGKVADVTLQASCRSVEESVLKVSSSCSSVYVDGSEVRGSSNASVLVQYGPYSGVAKFTVWTPEYPLEVSVGDQRLSQVKGWRVPDLAAGSSISKTKRSPAEESSYTSSGRFIRGGGWLEPLSPDEKLESADRPHCRLRFQQTNVEVYSRFYADDHDVGRISFFSSKRTWLRVTDLVLGLLRVSDARIASLHGRTLQGQSVGRTEVQVVSPVTGRVLGAKEIRVSNDRVSVSGLTVRVVSGLQLSISPDGTANGYVATTSVTRRLTAQYQEGLLDVELRFNDDTSTALRDVSVADYLLTVDSQNPEVVAFAPMAASPHPRVIAVGEGHGPLLRLTLRLPDRCAGPAATKGRAASATVKGRPPTPLVPSNNVLATAFADVKVDFSGSQRPEFVQNDGSEAVNYGNARVALHEITNIQDILIGVPMKDENNHEPTVQARQHPAQRLHAAMTPLEIGMYVLLGAFCLAIVVFVVSCVVYASKFKDEHAAAVAAARRPMAAAGQPHVRLLASSASGNKRDSTTNAHDWVWLGRATLERTQPRGPAVRLTANPAFQVASFDNPCHVELPSRPPPLNTATYCKRPASQNDNSEWHITEPPPLPPHASSALSPSDPSYKPPVPPHRNLNPASAPVSPPPRVQSSSSSPVPELPRRKGRGRGRGRSSAASADAVTADELLMVKRAHVVGNPMFSEQEQEELMASDVGLDLNLGMDYEQILEYFDNLKESNA